MWKKLCGVFGFLCGVSVGLRAKTYSCLIDDSCEDKKAKDTKECVIKKKLKFENYKNWLEATQLENKINHLEKNKIDKDRIKKSPKEFIRKNQLILKTQYRFKSEKHDVYWKS